MTHRPDQPSKDAPTPRKPLAVTPVGILIGSLLLWVISAAAAVLAQIGLQQIEFANAAARIGVSYLLYTPATLLALLGLVGLIVAAVRWGVYGRDVVGVPEPGDPQTLELLRSINQRLLLSETTKRIAYRQQDLQVLRRTIEQDIAEGHFDAAMVLVAELAQTYGYREEAEVIRERISAARMAEQEAKITESLARLEEILARHDFDRAMREAAKIQRLFPESERVKDLSRRVVHAREQYKQQLEREFLEAAQRDDVDRAMDVLKVLDKYLTEEEAEPLRETARGVIGKKRDNLGVQFKMAVHDREWMQAVRVGEQIIREFPNSRMAEEVRGMIDLLRERAAGQQAARPHEPVR